jgi:hypothetical protein
MLQKDYLYQKWVNVLLQGQCCLESSHIGMALVLINPVIRLSTGQWDCDTNLKI